MFSDDVKGTRTVNPKGAGVQLRDELVRAATELLVAPQPLAAPSLRATARRCGVSPSAVYLHFGSQKELLLAVIEAQFAELRAALDAADAPASPAPERLRAAAHAYVRWGLAHPGAYQLLFETPDVFPDDADGVQGPGTDLLERIGALVGDGPAALRLWCALHGVVSLRLHKPTAPWMTSVGADVDAAVMTHDQ